MNIYDIDINDEMLDTMNKYGVSAPIAKRILKDHYNCALEACSVCETDDALALLLAYDYLIAIFRRELGRIEEKIKNGTYVPEKQNEEVTEIEERYGVATKTAIEIYVERLDYALDFAAEVILDDNMSLLHNLEELTENLEAEVGRN